MKIPTKMVIVRASGHKCLVNESDFNPAIHEEAIEKQEAEKAPAPKAEQDEAKKIEAQRVVPDKQPPPDGAKRPKRRKGSTRKAGGTK